MPSFRKPWPMSRRDTDSVAMNTLEDKAPEASAIEVDKDAKAAEAAEDLKAFTALHRYYAASLDQ